MSLAVWKTMKVTGISKNKQKLEEIINNNRNFYTGLSETVSFSKQQILGKKRFSNNRFF